MTASDGRPAVVRHVQVDVVPEVAFRAFTDEMHRWWVPGPINFFDSARAITVRCEGGVGGRLVEVYDAESGDGLELGHITAWDPPSGLSWTSSIDDVTVIVSFERSDQGTRVQVEIYVPTDGENRGGGAWAQVVPMWFPAWCALRDSAPPGAPPLSRLAVVVDYDRPAAAARWLHDVLGLNTPSLPTDDADAGWVDLRAGDALVVVRAREGENSSPSAAIIPWLFVDDLDGHHATARAAGADVGDIHEHGYRAYTVHDLEGRAWTIAQSLPSVEHPPWP